MSGTPSGIGGRIDAALLNLPAFGVLRIEGGASALGTQRGFRAIGRRAPLGRDGVPLAPRQHSRQRVSTQATAAERTRRSPG
ncbi:Peptidase T4 (fragment) [Micropruina glycogenica]|uniref:Peptidase T4 n=1 Tax=Micropruina glycogenica TaxID=75385 RepID=A0A2N9JL02_9ACTN